MLKDSVSEILRQVMINEPETLQHTAVSASGPNSLCYSNRSGAKLGQIQSLSIKRAGLEELIASDESREVAV